MTLISVKNPDLYRGWIDYLMKKYCVEDSTPQIRTEAFFYSQAGKDIPWS